MKIKNVFIITVLMAMVTMLAPATLVLAGGDPPPPIWDKVTGPEIWGTAVVHCVPGNDNFIAFRVKRINDCNVQTDARVEIPLTLANACPDNSDIFLYQKLLPGSIFAGEDRPPL